MRVTPVWIICSDHDGTTYGAPFGTRYISGNSKVEEFKILDVDFFDDHEVALLIRFTGKAAYRTLPVCLAKSSGG